MRELNYIDEKIKKNENPALRIGSIGRSALSPVVSSELLANWNTAIVDLYRNGGMFVAYDVRLRNCSLHYNDVCNEYYVRYRDVTFGMHDIYNRR